MVDARATEAKQDGRTGETGPAGAGAEPDGPEEEGAPWWVVDRAGLDALIDGLRRDGHRPVGPVVRDGAIVHGEVTGADDLPRGWRDHQAPGSYHLEASGDDRLFAWAVGPASWKSTFFPPEETLWRAGARRPVVSVEDEPPLGAAAGPVAIVGARPCELAALGILDRVLAGGAHPDPAYRSRRAGAFVVVAECAEPADTCFCTSMGTGPAASGGFDLALFELPAGGDDDRDREGGPPEDGPVYLVRAGSTAGADRLATLARRPAGAGDLAARAASLATARARIRRRLDTDGLAGRLAAASDHPRWDDVAGRCLSCGNCTLVCPTCFCSDVEDVSDLDGDLERRRRWASCFDLRHSFVHSGPTRPSTRSRYRQWLTHKLSTWWDQFETSGCVGCGRCITWCPVGIDITEEASAIGARPVPAGADPGGAR